MPSRAAADPGRWAELFERHSPDALRLAYLLTGDREVARDLVQDAFVRLFARWRDVRDPDAFGAYVRRTVVNLSRDHWRRRRVQRRFLARESASRRPRAALPDVEERDEIWRALGRLPDAQRVALVLRFYEDLTQAQIAEATRSSVPAVKSRLARGMAALRTEIEKERT